MFEIKKININLPNLIIFSSLSIVLIAWVGTLLSILGAFKLLIPILIIVAVFLVALFLKIKPIFSVTKTEILLILSLALLAIANGYFYHESIDHDRDHGEYISSAINIAKTGSFEAKEEYMQTYPSYRIKSGEIISLLVILPVPAYPSFLAFIYQLFGIYGIFWSNAIFFSLFLLIVYLIGIEFGNKKIGLIFIVLFSTHYLTIWFTRRTNNETFFMFLLWLGVYLFLKGYTSKEKYYFYLSLLPLSIIPLVRVEGVLYYIPFSLALFLILLREGRIKNILLIFVALSILSIPLYLSDFTREIVIRFIQESLPILKLQSQQVLAPMEQNGPYWKIFAQNIHVFTFDMFSYYLLTPLVIILILYILKHRYNSNFILMLILISPAFYFLINPSISPDQPWFMRRFWPHIIVLLFLVPSIIIGNMKLTYNRDKLIFGTIFLLLLFGNLIYSSKIITFSENRGAVEQLGDLDKKLPNDVYIFALEGKGNYLFIIPMHFLFDRPVINNRFEQENWRTITIDEFTRFVPENKEVIVILPIKNIPKDYYNEYFNNRDLKYVDSFIIKVPRMSLTADLLGYQTPVPSDIREGKTIITYEWIKDKSKGTPPTNISTQTFEFFIFKLYNENSKLALFRKNVSLIDGWERKEEYL